MQRRETMKPRPKMRVLVVDDNEDSIIILKIVLGELGIQTIIPALTYREAEARIAGEEEFDLILLSDQLPFNKGAGWKTIEPGEPNLGYHLIPIIKEYQRKAKIVGTGGIRNIPGTEKLDGEIDKQSKPHSLPRLIATLFPLPQ